MKEILRPGIGLLILAPITFFIWLDYFYELFKRPFNPDYRYLPEEPSTLILRISVLIALLILLPILWIRKKKKTSILQTNRNSGMKKHIVEMNVFFFSIPAIVSLFFLSPRFNSIGALLSLSICIALAIFSTPMVRSGSHASVTAGASLCHGVIAAMFITIALAPFVTKSTGIFYADFAGIAALGILIIAMVFFGIWSLVIATTSTAYGYATGKKDILLSTSSFSVPLLFFLIPLGDDRKMQVATEGLEFIFSPLERGELISGTEIFGLYYLWVISILVCTTLILGSLSRTVVGIAKFALSGCLLAAVLDIALFPY